MLKKSLLLSALLLAAVSHATARMTSKSISSYNNIIESDNICTTQKEADATKSNHQTNHKNNLSLRANLLRWATATPDLGIEWRINPSLGIQINGSWAPWKWDNKNRHYALWEVSPEIRYYIGKSQKGYLGLLYKAGEFNYKLSGTGTQGNIMGGGITGGYQLKLNKALSLDFNLGLGYLYTDYEKYSVTDGICIRQDKETKNWWGLVSAGVTLVWKMF